MQRTSITLLDFIRLPVEKKPGFGNGVTSGLTTYADDFPDLPLKVSELEATNAALTSGITDAQTGNHVAKAGLITLEKAWDAAFRTTGKYVGGLANGDIVLIEKGGFEPTKTETTTPQVPGAVKNFNAEPEKASGTVTVGCDAADGVKGYLFIAAQNGANITQSGNTIVITVGEIKVFVEVDTHRKIMMHNLTAKTEFNVSMAAFNSAGCGPLSNAQNLLTQ